MGYFLTAVLAQISGCVTTSSPTCTTTAFIGNIATPLLTIAQIMVPGIVGITSLHKVMEHQESGGSFLINMVTKGGGAVLILQLLKSVVQGV
jgi:hypothetical protein